MTRIVDGQVEVLGNTSGKPFATYVSAGDVLRRRGDIGGGWKITKIPPMPQDRHEDELIDALFTAIDG